MEEQELNEPVVTGKKKNISIHPRKRKRETVLRRARNHAKNLLTRANLYREWQGDKGWNQDKSEWHSTIAALSLGTA